MRRFINLAATAAACTIAFPAIAQEANGTTAPEEIAVDSGATTDSSPNPVAAPAETTPPPAAAAEPVEEVAYKTASDGSICELHVWPTENYLGIKMGLLSGFGVVGVLADQEANKGAVTTVKDLMREYLGPDVQMQELEKLNFAETLGLEGYKIVLQEATPFNEDVKEDPELKAKVKAMNKTLKAGYRLSDSKAPCYAELITTHIFYHKAMMYGSNLFTGWQFREFAEGKEKAVFTGKGQVKNPLEEFPPKTEDMIEPAKAELRDAYSKDFTEYVEKKVMKKKKR